MQCAELVLLRRQRRILYLLILDRKGAVAGVVTAPFVIVRQGPHICGPQQGGPQAFMGKLRAGYARFLLILIYSILSSSGIKISMFWQNCG